MKHAYEPVQISGFTMSGQVYFYAISDAVEPIENVTMTLAVYDWLGTKCREEQRMIRLATMLGEPVPIETFLSGRENNI